MKQKCKQCGKEFELSEGEVEFYRKKGLSLPKRCKSCRNENRSGSSGGERASSGSAFWQKKPLWFCVLALIVIVAGAFFFKDASLPPVPADSGTSVSTTAPAQTEPTTSVPASENTSQPEQTAAPESTVPQPEQTAAPKSTAPQTEPTTASPETTAQQTEHSTPAPAPAEESEPQQKSYTFRNESYLEQHFEKHGGEFDYADKEEYLAGANRVINDPNALTKTEKEDGDFVYYLVESNEFVILSTDGYIRTYFRPSSGLDYFNRQ